MESLKKSPTIPLLLFIIYSEALIQNKCWSLIFLISLSFKNIKNIRYTNIILSKGGTNSLLLNIFLYSPLLRSSIALTVPFDKVKMGGSSLNWSFLILGYLFDHQL